MSDAEFEVPLAEPIMVIDTLLSRLVFRRAVGRDLIGLPNPETDGIGWSLTLASRTVKNAPPAAVLDLPAAVAIVVAGEVARRVPPTPPVSSSTGISSALASGVTSESLN